MAYLFPTVTGVRRWVRFAALGVVAVATAVLMAQVWAAPFVGIQDVQLSQTADKQLNIRFETDFPLTYSLSVAGINRMELVFPQARLADGVRNHLAQRGIMVGLQRLEWQNEGVNSRLILEGPQLATRRLRIEGATPSMIQSPGSSESDTHANSAPSMRPPPEPESAPKPAPLVTPSLPQSRTGPVVNAVSLAQPPTAQAPMPSYSASELVEQATQAYNAGNVSAALSLAQAATQKAPNNPAVWGSYGELLMEQEQYEQAVNAFRQALSQSLGSHAQTQQQVFLDRLAVAYRRMTPASTAADSLAAVMRLYPQASESLVLAHWMLGELYFEAGQFDDAERSLGHALTLEGDNVDIMAQLGLVYEMQGKVAQATRTFRQALQHDATHALARQGLTRLSPDDPVLVSSYQSEGMAVRSGPGGNTEGLRRQPSDVDGKTRKSRPHYSHLYRRRALQSVGGFIRPNY